MSKTLLALLLHKLKHRFVSEVWLKLLVSEGKETPSLNIDGANRYPGRPATQSVSMSNIVQKLPGKKDVINSELNAVGTSKWVAYNL